MASHFMTLQELMRLEHPSGATYSGRGLEISRLIGPPNEPVRETPAQRLERQQRSWNYNLRPSQRRGWYQDGIQEIRKADSRTLNALRYNVQEFVNLIDREKSPLEAVKDFVVMTSPQHNTTSGRIILMAAIYAAGNPPPSPSLPYWDVVLTRLNEMFAAVQKEEIGELELSDMDEPGELELSDFAEGMGRRLRGGADDEPGGASISEFNIGVIKRQAREILRAATVRNDRVILQHQIHHFYTEFWEDYISKDVTLEEALEDFYEKRKLLVSPNMKPAFIISISDMYDFKTPWKIYFSSEVSSHVNYYNQYVDGGFAAIDFPPVPQPPAVPGPGYVGPEVGAPVPPPLEQSDEPTGLGRRRRGGQGGPLVAAQQDDEREPHRAASLTGRTSLGDLLKLQAGALKNIISMVLKKHWRDSNEKLNRWFSGGIFHDLEVAATTNVQKAMIQMMNNLQPLPEYRESWADLPGEGAWLYWNDEIEIYGDALTILEDVKQRLFKMLDNKTIQEMFLRTWKVKGTELVGEGKHKSVRKRKL